MSAWFSIKQHPPVDDSSKWIIVCLKTITALFDVIWNVDNNNNNLKEIYLYKRRKDLISLGAVEVTLSFKSRK